MEEHCLRGLGRALVLEQVGGCGKPKFCGEGQVRGLCRALPTLCSTWGGGEL